MQRSMTDEQILDKYDYDREPYARDGWRADEAHAQPDYEPGVFGKMIDSSRWTYDPRPECIPSRYRPETSERVPRLPVNPILSWMRNATRQPWSVSARHILAEWPSTVGAAVATGIMPNPTSAETDFARKVLTRLTVQP
jgi:hypothetical protein